jgi:hypothetical protein
MNAPEAVKAVPALLRVIAAVVCAVFLLDSVGHFAHVHVATAMTKATTDAHPIKCGFCATFGGLIGTPFESAIPRPALAIMTVALLPDSPAPTRRLRLVALPRGPPVSPLEFEPRLT